MVLMQVLLEVSLDVSLGVLQLLLGDVQCSAKWFTAAVKNCLDDNMLDVAVTLCYLLVPRGNTCHESSFLPNVKNLIADLFYCLFLSI